MRKRHQKMLLELLGTLGRTNGKIAKLPPSNAAAITNLLADCQDCAEQIFDFVEQLEGEGTKTALYIKEYYELLYQASTELKGFEKLQKQIEKIEASVRSDLKPSKIEIAFFPYKASMWDSLESIWLAAKDDPACDAYVVPIPYYEKQPSGAFGQMRYEGREYPDYVPVVDWQKYNVEERHPDIIFIHNPYDNSNIVTSVHPDFYSEKLRGFTDNLIYVPYFVCGGDEVGEHFATTLGCVYAHKVIVQSEKIRESYIRAFKKQYGDRLGRPEDKFVALGSPKFDKAVNSKREDFALPDEWRKIIDSKKVVLYNTTIGALLEGNEKYLQKIRSVLDTFRNRDDVALLWRPHPLNEATYKTMRPQLLNEYGRIVEEYRREGWGIYDDTADLHRAIAWSDGYYGDGGSSVATVYKATGKPVVFQDVESTEDVVLTFADFAVDDEGNGWAFDLFDDGLFRLNFEDNTAHYVARSGCLPSRMGKEYLRNHRYVGIRSIGDKVFCFPNLLDNILIYNRFSGESDKEKLNYDYKLPVDSDDIFPIRPIAEYQGKIYCVGEYAKAIVVVDNADNRIKYDTKLFEKIGLLTDTRQFVKCPFYVSECSEDGKVTLLMRNCEHLIRYSLHTQNVEFIASNPVLSKCVRADFDGENFWLIAEKNDKLIKWNPVSNKVTKYDMSADGFIFPDSSPWVFTGISDCGEFLLIFPGIGSVLLKFDKKSCRFSEYKEIFVPQDFGKCVFKFNGPKRTKNKVYAFARYNYTNSTIYELDKISNKITPHRFCLDKESYEPYCNSLTASMFNDKTVDRLSDRNLGNIADFFAKAIPEMQKHGIKRLENIDGSSGIEIYKHARGKALK